MVWRDLVALVFVIDEAAANPAAGGERAIVRGSSEGASAHADVWRTHHGIVEQIAVQVGLREVILQPHSRLLGFALECTVHTHLVVHIAELRGAFFTLGLLNMLHLTLKPFDCFGVRALELFVLVLDVSISLLQLVDVFCLVLELLVVQLDFLL